MPTNVVAALTVRADEARAAALMLPGGPERDALQDAECRDTVAAVTLATEALLDDLVSGCDAVLEVLERLAPSGGYRRIAVTGSVTGGILGDVARLASTIRAHGPEAVRRARRVLEVHAPLAAEVSR